MATHSDTTTPSRRLFIAAGPASAVFAALGVAAAIPVLDPVFAAIERHKSAWDAFDAACSLTDNALARQQGREVTKADEAAFERANVAEQEALDGLMSTSPTTLAGMRAALEYAKPDDDSCIRVVATLLASPLLAT